MTDLSPHPDDEQLSAALDGEDEPGTRQHLRDCPVCVARLAQLDDVRQAVGGAVAPAPPGLADRVVGAALAAWADDRAAAGTAPEAERPGPIAAATPTPAPSRPAGAQSTERDHIAPVVPLRRRIPGWALGAAAAVAALVVAVPVLTRDSDDRSNDQLAATQSADEAATENALVYGGDLGAQADQRALNQVLQSAVASPALAAPAMTAEAADSAARTSGDSGGAAAAPSADSTVASPPPSQYATTRGGSVPSPCASTVRSEYGQGLGALVYQADLDWRGTPAVVLAYELAEPAGTGPRYRAFVMARDGCELLVAQGF